ncbi:MAG: xanthine dehydrogenase family protein subunit M [Verrucomicrobium sp.]
MDLPHVTSYLKPTAPDAIAGWAEGQAWLAGGTWLYSEPQPRLHTLIDIERFAWPTLKVTEGGLEIGATCKIAELLRFEAPPDWRAAPLFAECCHALQSSFKIWNEATVGGNVCLSLPAGALTALVVALEGECLLWPREGTPRRVPALDFVTGNQQNILQPGELLRSLHLPASALRKRTLFRRHALTQEGRSTVLLIGTQSPDSQEWRLTVTAAIVRPVQIRFEGKPDEAALSAALDLGIPSDLYFDDAHGTAKYRRHLTHHFAKEMLAELD